MYQVPSGRDAFTQRVLWYFQFSDEYFTRCNPKKFPLALMRLSARRLMYPSKVSSECEECLSEVRGDVKSVHISRGEIKCSASHRMIRQIKFSFSFYGDLRDVLQLLMSFGSRDKNHWKQGQILSLQPIKTFSPTVVSNISTAAAGKHFTQMKTFRLNPI